MRPSVRRGEVWQIDFGLAAKVRPSLILGCDIEDSDRALVTVCYYTTALRGSKYEVPMNIRNLKKGGFDCQSIYTIPAVKLIYRRGALTDAQLYEVELKVRLWLRLS
ncbi:MAG: type II toxin-antitoxin system PemK/MazF family toxin [Verrucomicrobiia bacterium]